MMMIHRCCKAKWLNIRRNLLYLNHCRLMSLTHYDVLGVKRNASAQEIKTAYRELCKKHHPDINKQDPTSHQKFVKINEAYQVLSERNSRRNYDQDIVHGHYADINPYTSARQHSNFRDEEYFRQYYAKQFYYGNRAHHEESSESRKYLLFVHSHFWKIVAVGIVVNSFFIYFQSRKNRQFLDERDKRLVQEYNYHAKNQYTRFNRGSINHKPKKSKSEEDIPIIEDKPPPPNPAENMTYIKKPYVEDIKL